MLGPMTLKKEFDAKYRVFRVRTKKYMFWGTTRMTSGSSYKVIKLGRILSSGKFNQLLLKLQSEIQTAF